MPSDSVSQGQSGAWIVSRCGSFGYAYLFATLDVSTPDAWGSCYYNSYGMSLPVGLFDSVMGVDVSIRTGNGIWWTQPYNVSADGFSYYVVSPRQESAASKDMVFIVTGVLA